MKKEASPCLTCSRVKDPGNCENKCCRVWGEWFLRQWEMIHGFYEKYAQKEEEK